MKVNITRKNKAYHLEAKNAHGNTASFDANESIGGENKGMRPMEMLLASLASCSSIDVIAILNKQKLNPEIFEVEVTGERVDAVPAVFKKIHVKFITSSDVDESKLKRAIDLSMDKYCSVTKMLEGSVEITHSYEIK